MHRLLSSKEATNVPATIKILSIFRAAATFGAIYLREIVSWESHAVAINQIKDHVNSLGKQVDRLKAARNEASPWQKAAIDRVTPYLDELGGYTEAIIDHLNGEDRRDFREYKDFLEANADYSSDLAAMIGEFVDYGNTKTRLERLGAKLEIHPK